MRTALILLSLMILTTLGIAPENVLMQTQCDLAEAVNYPFDTGQFRLAQAFSAPSPRHQGRYHTGEDWFAGRDNTLGTPVQAIAAGRVTYSYPLGWGRDGGVVIIEHTFPDGSIVYSMYGHMMETDTIKFPQRLSCVQMGDVIGAIGNIRPAPHLHLEIKLNGPDTPGPGYSWTNPYDEGWRQPSKFIINRQAWLTPAHRWHLMMTDPAGFLAPPLQLDDYSLMYIDGQTLRLATYDGRVLWRVLLDKPALAVTGYQRQPLVIYADGTVQIVDYEGQVVNGWQIPDIKLASAPIIAGEQLLFHTQDDALVAISADRRSVDWRLSDVPNYVEAYVTPRIIALLTQDHRLLLISRDGTLERTVQLRAAASFTTAPDGDLVVYGRGGLWRVDASEAWSLLHPTATLRGDSSDGGAVVINPNGEIYAFDGTALHAYSPDGSERWSLPLVITGQITMTNEDNLLLLTSTHGQIITASKDGVLCGVAQVYGDNQAKVWNQRGSDGILRVGVGDQLLGLDWQQLTGSCKA